MNMRMRLVRVRVRVRVRVSSREHADAPGSSGAHRLGSEGAGERVRDWVRVRVHHTVRRSVPQGSEKGV